MNNMNPLLKETIVFRPFDTNLLRYANGQWIPDDGLPDLAFVSTKDPIAFSVHMPDYSNILWSWRDLDLEKRLVGKALERNIYGWHYMTINNEEWDGHHWDKEKHPNEVAHRAATDKCCKQFSCANGRGPELTRLDDEYMRHGLIWVQSTMTPITKPDNPICFLCLNDGLGHKLEAFACRYRNTLSDKDETERQISGLEIDLYDAQDRLEHIEADLADWKKDPLYREDLI